MKSSTKQQQQQYHFTPILHKNTIIHIYASWASDFIINNFIIIKLTYPNISSIQEHEFSTINSQLIISHE